MADGYIRIATEIDIKNLQSQLDQVKKSLKDAKEKAGKDLAQIGAQFAAVAASAAVLVKAVQSVNATIDAYAQKTDRIDKMSQSLGLTRKTFQELDYAFSQNGASIDGMGIAMKNMQELTTKAVAGEKTAFDQLGVSITNANGTLKSQDQILKETLAAFNELSPGVDKSVLATQIFGRSAQELMPLLNQASGTIDGLRERAHELGLVLADEDVDAGVAFGDAVADLRGAFSALTQNAIAPFVSLITTVVQKITELVAWLNSGSTAAEVAKGAIIAVTAAVGGLVTVFMVLPTLITAVSTAFKVLTAAMASNPFGAIAVVITAVLIPALIAVYKNWDKVSVWIQEACAKLAARFKILGAVVVEAFTVGFNGAKIAAISLAQTIADKVLANVQKLLTVMGKMPFVGNMFDDAAKSVAGFRDKLDGAAQEAKKTSAQAIADAKAKKAAIVAEEKATIAAINEAAQARRDALAAEKALRAEAEGTAIAAERALDAEKKRLEYLKKLNEDAEIYKKYWQKSLNATLKQIELEAKLAGVEADKKKVLEAYEKAYINLIAQSDDMVSENNQTAKDTMAIIQKLRKEIEAAGGTVTATGKKTKELLDGYKKMAAIADAKHNDGLISNLERLQETKSALAQTIDGFYMLGVTANSSGNEAERALASLISQLNALNDEIKAAESGKGYRIGAAIAKGIARGIAHTAGDIGKAMQSLGKWIAGTSIVKQCVTAGKNAVNWIGDGIKNSSLAKHTTALFKSVANSKAVRVVKKAGESIVTWCGRGITAFKNRIVRDFGGAVEVAKLTAAIKEKMKNVGRFMATAAAAGLKGAAKLFTEAIKVIGKTVQAGFKAISAMANFDLATVSENFDAFLAGLSDFLTNDLKNLPAFIDAGVAAISAFIDGVVSALPEIIANLETITDRISKAIQNNLPAWIQKISAVLVQALPKLVTLLGDLITQLVTAIAENIDPILEAIKGVIYAINDTLRKNGKQIINAILQILKAVIQALVDTFPDIIDTINGLTPDIIRAIGELLPVLIKAIVSILKELVKSIRKWLPDIIDAINECTPDIVEAIAEALPEIIVAILDLIIAVVASIIQKLPQIIATLAKSLWIIIKSIFTELIPTLFNWFVDIGKQIISGIGTGIKKFGSWLWDGVKSVFKKFVNAVKKFFGIHSPSTLFADIGGNIIKGLINGIVKIGATIWSAIKSIFTTVVNAIKNVFANIGDWFGKVFSGAVSFIKNAFSNIGDFFSGIWSGIKNIFSNVGSWFSSVFSSAVSGIKNAWSGITGWFSNIASGIKNAFSGIGSWFSNLFSGIGSNIKSFATSAWDTIKGVGSSVASGVSSAASTVWDKVTGVASTVGNGVKTAATTVGSAIKSGIKKLKFWASGTESAPAGLAVVGEDGPELIELSGGERIHNARETKSLLSGRGLQSLINGMTPPRLAMATAGGSANYSFNIEPTAVNIDGRQIARVVWERLDRMAGRI